MLLILPYVPGIVLRINTNPVRQVLLFLLRFTEEDNNIREVSKVQTSYKWRGCDDKLGSYTPEATLLKTP